MGLDGRQDGRTDSVGPGSALVAPSLPGVLGFSMCRDDAPRGEAPLLAGSPSLCFDLMGSGCCGHVGTFPMSSWPWSSLACSVSTF